MSFTAYAQLQLPQVAGAFAHLGFPAYFRIELSWAKLAGVAALLVPMVPARLKEWAYAGFAMTLVSALVAHLGFPAYFRIELSWAKLAGVAALLVPMVPARLKEWAYAGFAMTLVSALVAHLAVGDGIQAWIWPVGTGFCGACRTSSSVGSRRRGRASMETELLNCRRCP